MNWKILCIKYSWNTVSNLNKAERRVKERAPTLIQNYSKLLLCLYLLPPPPFSYSLFFSIIMLLGKMYYLPWNMKNLNFIFQLNGKLFSIKASSFYFCYLENTIYEISLSHSYFKHSYCALHLYISFHIKRLLLKHTNFCNVYNLNIEVSVIVNVV